ncbi:MAG: tetratricopeptide repeat protein, partial [Alphaproteobacteria bacterium]|nr:tetratricopeptide repeat protein [Alphaproteobacteria bacterium]
MIFSPPAVAHIRPSVHATRTRQWSLAALYQVQGRYAEAEPLYKRALAIYEKALGPEKTETQVSGSDVHSGLWGNLAPDVSMALIKVLSRLIDDDGRLA